MLYGPGNWTGKVFCFKLKNLNWMIESYSTKVSSENFSTTVVSILCCKLSPL